MDSRKCGCHNHDQYSAGKEYCIIDIRHKTISKYIQKGLLGNSRSKFLCSACIDYFKGSNPPDPKKTKASVDHIIQAIQNGEVIQQDLMRLSRTIGETISSEIYDDCINISHDYSTEEHLLSFNADKWLKERHPVVNSFFAGVVGTDQNDSAKKTLCLVASIDCLYKARYLPLVTPLFFANNLISYHISGSKMICDIAANISPSGSYSTVLKWLSNESSTAIPHPPSSDLITFLDNNQVLARNWRVRYNSRLMVSVITTLIHTLPSKETSHQINAALSPSSWIHNSTITPDELCTKITLFSNTYIQQFSTHRNNFLANRISQIAGEQRFVNGTYVDDVDCGNLNVNVDRNDLFQMYQTYPHNHPTTPPKVIMGEPSLLNPCSYDSVKAVLKHIANQCDLAASREWTIVGSDGLPYVLGSRIIEQDASLQNIVLVPGLGHFEINMVRAMFKLLFDVILVDLAKMLNFKTAKALSACKNAYDHHKAWQILQIFFFATCDEMILTFVRDCLHKNIHPTLNDFYLFLSRVNDPNFIFLKDVVFTYLFALMLFRTGVRRNNTDLMLSARIKFSSLFFGLNMTFYQEIEYRDLKTRVLLPQQLKSFWTDNESFSVSGNICKGEGGDFVLEAKNRKCKQWMPAGVPDEKRWLRSVRNIDRLDKIRQKFHDQQNVESMYQVDLKKEIFHWRKEVRRTGYLQSPLEAKPHTTFSGEEVDKDLVNFACHCKGNKDIFFRNVSSGLAIGKGEKLNPIFITKQDRKKFNDIGQKTKCQIIDLITQCLQKIRDGGNDDAADILQDTWEREKLKTAKKETIIAFYKEAVCTLDNSSFPCDDDEDCDNF